MMAVTAEQMRLQRMANLAKGQHVRLTNAETLRALRGHRDMLVCLDGAADILRHGDFTGPLGSVTVEGFLDRGVWGVSKPKAQQIADEAQVGAHRALGSLTVRQRHGLAKVLGGRAAVLRYKRRWR